MCAVVGVKLDVISFKELELIKRVIEESEIRGRHATGVAFYNGKLNAYKENIPPRTFLKKFDLSEIIYNNSIRAIFHIRYSTSDIHYPQPIGNEKEGFIVHNGVISQEPPELWETSYNILCETKNDTELLFHWFKNTRDKSYLQKFPGCSASAVFLAPNGKLINFRNGLRPQWKATLKNGYIIASTKNILLRADKELNLIENIEKVIPDDLEKIDRTMDFVPEEEEYEW